MGLELGYIIPYDIVIKASVNKGFIVNVGCAVLVAESRDKLISGLEEYLKDPKGWEKKYSEVSGGRGPIPEATDEASPKSEPLVLPRAGEHRLR